VDCQITARPLRIDFPGAVSHPCGSGKNSKNAASDVPGIKTRKTTKDILAAVRESKGRFAGQKVED
jgi:hypothetical protein